MLAEESQRGKEGEDPFQNHIIIQAFCTQSPIVVSAGSEEHPTTVQQKNNIHLSQLKLCWKKKSEMLTLLGNVTFDTHSKSIKHSKWDVYVIILAPRAQGVSWKREMKAKVSGARDGIG